MSVGGVRAGRNTDLNVHFKTERQEDRICDQQREKGRHGEEGRRFESRLRLYVLGKDLVTYPGKIIAKNIPVHGKRWPQNHQESDTTKMFNDRMKEKTRLKDVSSRANVINYTEHRLRLHCKP